MVKRLTVITTGYAGAPGYNNHYSNAAGPTDVAAWVESVRTCWSDLASVLANGTVATFDGTVTEINTVTGQPEGVEGGAAFNITGTWGTGKSLPGLALVAQWQTGVYANGRQIRGRSFISGLGDWGDSAGNIPNSILIDARNAVDGIASDGLGAVYSPTNGLSPTITLADIWTKCGLIRSRRD